MLLVANVLVFVVALLHIGFLVLEMFLWDHPFGRKRFRMTPEYSKASATLAANQGLYNGFLAAGLIWGLITGDVSIKTAGIVICFFIIFSNASRAPLGSTSKIFAIKVL